MSLFVVSPGEEAPAAGFEAPGPAVVPWGVPPGGAAFLMTLNASGVSLSETGPPGGGAFSMTLNAGGRGLSEATGPPGAVALSWVLKASGSADCAAPGPEGWDDPPPSPGWGTVLGGRRTVVAGEGRVLTVGTGRVVDVGGVATRGGSAPGRPGRAPAGFPSPMTMTPATLFLASNMRL